MSFIQYIRGERRGKDARDVEMQSLGDPCYHKALLGYDRYRVSGSDKVRDIAELGNRISGLAFTKKSYKLLYIAATLIVVVVAVCVWLISYSEIGGTPTADNDVAGKTVLSPENERQPVDENLNIVVTDEGVAKTHVTDISVGAEESIDATDTSETDQMRPLPQEQAIETGGKPLPAANIPPAEAVAADNGETAGTVGTHSGLPMFTVASHDEGGKPISAPELGNTQYNEYLRRAMDMSAAGGTGDVMLTFRVNQYGRPSDIRAELGFSRDGNREAIRLISNGPEWQPTGEERVSVTIHFR